MRKFPKCERYGKACFPVRCDFPIRRALANAKPFFHEIKLGDILAGFDGTIVAQSAGSMNCAKTAYICPEIPGESLDSDFRRFRPGLGLTDINIVPHYNCNCDLILDGKRLYDDIIYPDTFKIPIYVLSDGSYIHIHNDVVKHFGEIYLFHRGEIKPIPSYDSSTNAGTGN